MKLPDTGCVLGIDVGYSAKRATTGLCLLSWNRSSVNWDCLNTTTDRYAGIRALGLLLADVAGSVLAVGIDGPLRPDLKVQDTYRACESLLSRGVFQFRGKACPSNGGSGPSLHAEATTLANLAIETCNIEKAQFWPCLHYRAVVEAFPNMFLGVLCNETDYPAKPAQSRRWTDSLFPIVRETLVKMLSVWLPGRRIEGELNLTDHEHIAGLVCALSALSAVTGDGVFVGSADDGYIVLPPFELWGKDRSGLHRWADRALSENLPKVRERFTGASILHLNQ